MWYVIVNLLFITVLILVCEVIAYTNFIRSDILRKLMHIATGAVVIYGSYITDYKAYTYVSLLMVVALVSTRYLFPLRSLQHRFKESYGEVYFAIGAGIAALLNQTFIGFAACVAALALADTAAYIAGTQIKSRELYNGKTVAGLIACFIVTSLIFIGLGYDWTESIVIGIFIAGAELISDRGLDNATIPIVGSLLLLYFS